MGPKGSLLGVPHLPKCDPGHGPDDDDDDYDDDHDDDHDDDDDDNYNDSLFAEPLLSR